MSELRFSFWEMLSLVGVFQCVYILVYIFFRVTNFRQTILPALYFLVLCAAFFMDFAKTYIGQITPYYDYLLFGAWTLTLPVSVLLVLQIAQLSKLPDWPYWGVLAFLPLGFVVSEFAASRQGGGQLCSYINNCSDFMEWLRITGLVFGALSLLLVWGKRKLIDQLHAEKSGKERYWLILSIIMVNIGFLSIFALETGYHTSSELGLARTIFGLVFIYLVTTSLFRIYPQALVLANTEKKPPVLTADDKVLADRVNKLIVMDKVYQEPNYSRSDLARELGVSEASLSRVINLHYKKTLPQLLNEQRIEDAKRLLLDTDANIKIVAQEVGFNSIPSFNRVFKELEGRSPSDYRRSMVK